MPIRRILVTTARAGASISLAVLFAAVVATLGILLSAPLLLVGGYGGGIIVAVLDTLLFFAVVAYVAPTLYRSFRAP